MTEQVSGNPTTAPLTPQDTMPVDPTVTLLQEIKDADGRQKYADTATALKALKDSQDHIQNQYSELQTLRQQAEFKQEVKTVSELLKSAAPEATQNQVQDPVTPAIPEQVKSQEPSLEEQFTEFMAKKEASDTQASNLDTVKAKLAEMYGEKSTEMYEAKATELGIKPEFLDQMAGTSAAAVLEYFKSSGVAPGAQGTVNTSGLPAPAPAAPAPVMIGATQAQVQASWDACHPDNRN